MYDCVGLPTCKFNPCLYMHPGREMMCLVHGDDFVCVGGSTNLTWFKSQLAERFEIKTKLMGLKAGESREERILNRVIRVTPEEWEYEADQRHADLIIQESGAKASARSPIQAAIRELLKKKKIVRSCMAKKRRGSEL